VASSSSTYKWSTLTCCSLGTDPCIPILIIFHHSPTGIDPILREILPLNTLMSIMDVKKSSQPSEVGFSDWSDDFHSPNLVFWSHIAVAFMMVGKGPRKPRRAKVYVLPPLAQGLAPGKYSSHSSTLPGMWSGSSSGSGRSSSIL